MSESKIKISSEYFILCLFRNFKLNYGFAWTDRFSGDKAFFCDVIDLYRKFINYMDATAEIESSKIDEFIIFIFDECPENPPSCAKLFQLYEDYSKFSD